ncbi:cell division protein FtsA [Candidatus Dependentiae bacterium]|nr:cell division protein FtsA [Candidatus Dependentiae bacterium]MBU4386923.1 cell division protein FtsA [Candidatus Dependentiae bacterium]MCG2756400.1 cell division protein FtsA [Candidatus Dependentiae bacterium]
MKSNKIFSNVFTAIDIGTTKICVLIGTNSPDGNLELLGIGQYPSYGLKKGVVVNIAKTVESISKALAQAEQMAGCKVEYATVGISGGHIKSFNSTGVVAIKNSDVKQEDIDRVIEAAKAVPIPKDQEILHVLTQYFKVDGQDRILDSIGMNGVRLEAQVHIITGAISSAQNIIKSCEMAGIKVSDIVLEQIASADAVLSKSEKELGVGILDIGGGTSDFAIYKDGRIIHSKVVPIAGNHFTNDLAVGLGIPIGEAEELKKKYGFVWEEKYLELDKDKIEIRLGYQNKTKKIETFSTFEILQPRAEEIFDFICDELVKFNLKAFMPSGLVLTGGGSMLLGMADLAEKRFGLPVRIGYPDKIQDDLGLIQNSVPEELKNPIYSTGYGLLVYAGGHNDLDFSASQNEPAFKKVFKKMKSWIYDFI